MKQRRFLIAGNWKMHGSSVVNRLLLSELQNGVQQFNSMECDVAICVPFPYLAQVHSTLQTSSIAWGAQDVSAHVSGAYTGEVAASMLHDFSCAFTIVGHSERRAYHAESDALIGQKTLRLLEQGITPIVCVGETLAERKDNLTEKVVIRQLQAVLSAIDEAALSKMVIAYEPVWAIGTGMTATPEMAQQVHGFLRRQLTMVNAQAAEQVRILYGGSMKPENAAALLGMPDVDGGLIGGASLKAPDFLNIIAAAKR